MKAPASLTRYVALFFSLLSLLYFPTMGCGGNQTNASQDTANEQSRALALLVSGMQTYAVYAALSFQSVSPSPPESLAENSYPCPNGGSMARTDATTGAIDACAFPTFSSTGTTTYSDPSATIEATVTSSYEDASEFAETLVAVINGTSADMTLTGVFDSDDTLRMVGNSVTGTPSEGRLLVSGTFEVTQNDASLGTCTFQDMDILTASCADYAATCGYSDSLCP